LSGEKSGRAASGCHGLNIDGSVGQGEFPLNGDTNPNGLGFVGIGRGGNGTGRFISHVKFQTVVPIGPIGSGVRGGVNLTITA
jgi:hypothetical protein